MAILTVAQVKKRFGAQEVLRDVTFEVGDGEVYGLVGPNGAGKSTLIHMLLGLVRPDSGVVRVFGESPREACTRIGYLPEHIRFYPHFTAEGYLRSVGALYQLRGQVLRDRCQSLLRFVGLGGVGERQVRQFSKGMVQRLGIAQALIHDPALLVLDEPSSGLDAKGQGQLLDVLLEVRSRGHTIVLCSHYLMEIERLCARVGVLFEGRMAAEARVSDLQLCGSLKVRVVAPMVPQGVVERLQGAGLVVQVAGAELFVRGGRDVEAQVMRVLQGEGVQVAEVFPPSYGVAGFYAGVVRPFGARVARSADQVGAGRSRGG